MLDICQRWYLYCFFAAVPRLSRHQNSWEGLLKAQTAGPQPRVSDAVGLGWPEKLHFSKRPQVMLTLLVQRKHCENPWFRWVFHQHLVKSKEAATLHLALRAFKWNPLSNHNGYSKYENWHKSNTNVVMGCSKCKVLTGLEFQFQPL